MAKRSGANRSPRPARPLSPVEPLAYSQPIVRRRPTADSNLAADYIASMLAELAAMSGEARLDLLTYLIQLARVEAEGLALQG